MILKSPVYVSNFGIFWGFNKKAASDNSGAAFNFQIIYYFTNIIFFVSEYEPEVIL
jgi:hypothetical protein